MKDTATQPLQQIRTILGRASDDLVGNTAEEVTIPYRLEQESYESALLNYCPAEKWPKAVYRAGCPRPILVTEYHQRQVVELHDALVLAITDIVERWWTDDAAQLPLRMPLEKEEEHLLQWMEGQIPHALPEFRNAMGSWRPDFLVDEGPQKEGSRQGESFCITEINARFSFNASMIASFGQQGLLDIGIGRLGLDGAADPAKIIQGLCRLFRPDRPLHLLKGKEAGLDIHMLVDFFNNRLGLTLRIIHPDDLRLVPDDLAPQGYKLCCVVRAPEYRSDPHADAAPVSDERETVEEIHQIGLELHQQELFALPKEILRHVSLRCFNDLRTIFLVHDKRMLGIVREEIDALVRRSVISECQADILRKGIADTLIPGSADIQELLQRSKENPELRGDYLLKPIRGGKGAGIIFGDELSSTEWVSHLERLKGPELASDRTNYVVQRQVKQREYDLKLGASGRTLRAPLVGTYFVVHGELLGLGGWRCGAGRICAVSNGGSWICSVIQRQ